MLVLHSPCTTGIELLAACNEMGKVSVAGSVDDCPHVIVWERQLAFKRLSRLTPSNRSRAAGGRATD